MRLLDQRDLQHVAELHVRAFPDAAVSMFGGEAAQRFYESLLSGPHQQEGFGSFSNGRLVGFVFGGRANEVERYFLRRNFGWLAWLLARRPWLLLHARVLRRMLLGLRLLFRWPAPSVRGTVPSEELVKESYGIQAIAVDPACRREGIGGRLLQAAADSARRKGFSKMLLSVHADNRPAILFYERHGWLKWGDERTWRGFMVRELG